jgi:ceramide glucosyltransferase
VTQQPNFAPIDYQNGSGSRIIHTLDSLASLPRAVQISFLALVQYFGLALAMIAAVYSVLALAATYRSRRRDACYSLSAPAPVSVLKPLCGPEARLYEDLRSFCNQEHPCVQILFAVSDSADPAITTVRRLQREFAALDIELVIDPTQHGSNRKISNLINMLPRVKYDHLVMADSDVAVPRDYLKRVCAPLADPSIGLVTCPYYGHALAGSASTLGAIFINEWFMPAVDVAALFGSQSFVSGATIAIRRELLEQLGGFAQLRDQLADDYRLGQLVRAQGRRVMLSSLQVATSVDEPSFEALCRHQLRWLRTIQSIQPVGYAFSCVTFSLPVALLGAALASFHAVPLLLLGGSMTTRLVLHWTRDGAPGPAASGRTLALVLLHDALLPLLWCWSFVSRQVSWREQRFDVGRDGSLHRAG